MPAMLCPNRVDRVRRVLDSVRFLQEHGKLGGCAPLAGQVLPNQEHPVKIGVLAFKPAQRMHHSSAFRVASLCERLPPHSLFVFRFDRIVSVLNLPPNPTLFQFAFMPSLMACGAIQARSLSNDALVSTATIARRRALILIGGRPFAGAEKARRRRTTVDELRCRLTADAEQFGDLLQRHAVACQFRDEITTNDPDIDGPFVIVNDSRESSLSLCPHACAPYL